MKETFWKGALLVALMAVTWLALAPAPPDPTPSTGGADKLKHVVLFAALALVARPAYPRLPSWGIFVSLVLYGVALELAQARVPGRSADALDVLADAAGAALAFLPRR